MRAGLLHGSGRHQILERDDLRLDEPPLKVGVDHSGGLWRRGTLRNRPGPCLLGPRGQVCLQSQRVKTDPRQRLDARLVLTDGLQQLQGLLLRQFSQFCLDLCVKEDGLRGRHQRGHPGLEVLIGKFLLVAVDDIDERFGGEQEQFAQRQRVDAGREQGLAAVENLAGLGRCRNEGCLVLGHPRLLLQPRQRLLKGLQVSQDEFGVDGLHVLGR